jgi:hypothetical protein
MLLQLLELVITAPGYKLEGALVRPQLLIQTRSAASACLLK